MALETIRAHGGIAMACVAELPWGIDWYVAPVIVLLRMTCDTAFEAAFIFGPYAPAHGVIALVLEHIHVIAPHLIDWGHTLLTHALWDHWNRGFASPY
jgi:hypothetical protein